MESEVNKVSWPVRCPWTALPSVIRGGEWKAVDRQTLSLSQSGAFSMLQLADTLFSIQAETQVPAQGQ